MPPLTKVSDVTGRCIDLKRDWSNRDAKFKEWYNLLLQKDELEEKDMESFVSNDPRTLYNFSLQMLDQPMNHRIPVAEKSSTDITATSEIETYMDTVWRDIEKKYRRRGDQSFYITLIKFILATGWYAVFAPITNDMVTAEAWNPIEVYPDFGDDELTQCAHIYNVSATAARRKIQRNGWLMPANLRTVGNMDIYDYWRFNDEGKAANSVVIDTHLVKPETPDLFEQIPIFISPVAGLPDKGSIGTKIQSQQHIGEGIVATNEQLYKRYNKQWTFATQLLRDVAQPRWFERSAGTEAILRPEDMFKRGGVFRGGLQDTIEPLPVPPIPVELRTDRFDVQQMLQRGGFSWAVYGNVMQAISGYLMSQIASSVKSALKPYHNGVIAVLSDTNNFWLAEIERRGLHPYDFKLPKTEKKYVVDCTYDIQVPGDFMQRATLARMLNPQYELSWTTVTDMLFPEIKNPLQEQARTRKDNALRNPVMAALDLIASLREEAETLRKAQDTRGFELFSAAAARVEQQLQLEAAPAEGPPSRSRVGDRPEATGRPHGVPPELEGARGEI